MSLATVPIAEPRCTPPPAVLPAALRAPVAGVPAERGEIELALELRHSGRRRIVLRYELLGDRSRPAVFVAGGISAHRHVAASDAFPDPGWWEAQAGSGRALDADTRCIVAFDWLGGDGALDCVIDPADQADAVAALLDALGIDRLDAFVGSSYGAMVGLQFAARHATRLERLVAISGVHRSHPYASAWRALQRQAVALGALQCDEPHGLSLARQLAILSYRTPAEFAQRFGAATVEHGRVRVAAEGYLEHCGAKFVAKTSPTAFLRLSESIDLQQVEPETIDVPVTVVAVAEDGLVPVEDARALAGRLRGETRLCVLHSIYGHDAFLKEEAQVEHILRQSLGTAREATA